MAVNFRGPVDPIMEEIGGAIRAYTDAHPGAEADIHRYGNAIVQAWIVDPDFCGKSNSERLRAFWPLLDALDDEISAELTTLLLLTPEEKDEYAGHIDFDNPVTFDEEYETAVRVARGGGIALP